MIVLVLLGAANLILVWALWRTTGRRRDENRLEGLLRDEFRADRTERGEASRADREELSRVLDQLAGRSEERGEKMREVLEKQLNALQKSNETRLEEMRRTVDEKLQSTLEKRLGESFKLVAGQLEAVQRGLGEMKELATGVGDLKRMLTNVKARGTWGEVQLGQLLEQVLTPAQYAHNVKVHPDSNELVEYAVRLPGPDNDSDRPVWLPIDAKFPQEDYLRLVDASQAGDADAVRAASAALARAVKAAAKTVQTKYVAPPYSTDFAILFLPIEGLYAEVLRVDGLVETLQREHRIVIAGPTTLLALLNSLQMGFRTLALEKRTSEIWKVLGAVKTEFDKFGGVLEKVRKQLATAARTIDETDVRRRAMQRQLKDVETLSEDDASTEEIDWLPVGASSEETEK
jgi:DNA recombination protein RmuC